MNLELGVELFDSLYSVTPAMVKAQIAGQHSAIDVQKQVQPYHYSLSLLCGLYAAAYTTALAHGSNPVESLFEQRTMRPHLYTCLSDGKLTPFSQTNRTSNTGQWQIICDEVAILFITHDCTKK